MRRVPEVLVHFDEAVASPSGARYHARVLGAPTALGQWEGWLEFTPVALEGVAIETDRETSQPNRVDLDYWATGLSRVYLEGALGRALDRAARAARAARDAAVERLDGDGFPID